MGIKTPVISIGTHGVKHGLYNMSAGSDCVVHMIIVRACDADAYKLNFPNHVIVVLPEEFDFLGKGKMKIHIFMPWKTNDSDNPTFILELIFLFLFGL